VVGDDSDYVEKALNQGVILTPGIGFGAGGKGWVRATMTQPEDRLHKALELLAVL
jgi:aspartate/methionine/tyrosine aminotransferase